MRKFLNIYITEVILPNTNTIYYNGHKYLIKYGADKLIDIVIDIDEEILYVSTNFYREIKTMFNIDDLSYLEKLLVQSLMNNGIYVTKLRVQNINKKDLY